MSKTTKRHNLGESGATESVNLCAETITPPEPRQACSLECHCVKPCPVCSCKTAGCVTHG
ncbi:MAG: hypothetical protein PHN84_15540 [Desulfuromonadaceae bacterium]|nr:hypothetical protein [Desulfuromonadaceae bacterium]